MRATVTIYRLRDPFTRRIRYIGASSWPQVRIKAHVSACKTTEAHTRKGRWIEMARLACGMTRKHLAIASLVSVDTICSAEQGKVRTRPLIVHLIAHGLRCEESWLSHGTGQAPAGAWLQLMAMRARRAAESAR